MYEGLDGILTAENVHKIWEQTCEIIISGLVVVISGAVTVEIGKTLGITWDGVAENWNNFLSDVQNELGKVFALQWVKTANHKGKESMNAVYDYYTALGSPKGKDDKWYFEARKNHDKVEVNMKRLTEDQAVKKMEEGKDIMTLDQKLAQKVVNLFKNGGPGRVGDLKVEEAHHNHQKADGHYDHLHYGRNADERLHCWIWKNTYIIITGSTQRTGIFRSPVTTPTKRRNSG